MLAELCAISLMFSLGCSHVLEVPEEYEEEIRNAEMEMDLNHPGWRNGTPIEPPEMNLTDEEWHSPTLPASLMCDGCQAVAHQFHTAFEKVHDIRKLHKEGQRIPEHEVIDMAEDLICQMDTFSGYGLGEGKGRNHIKGAGVASAGGFAMMGDAMPRWLVRVCQEMLELDEVTIYEEWLSKGRSGGALFNFFCREQNDICDDDLNAKEGWRKSKKNKTEEL